ncbi:hypothetical protein CBS101457_005026 [Exobasidium rhododendri]|nr:hypothetical protein CBS101457_005026 [Exobasidium rhododendri]
MRESSGEAQTVYLDDLEFFTRKAAPSLSRASLAGAVNTGDEEDSKDEEDGIRSECDTSDLNAEEKTAYAKMQKHSNPSTGRLNARVTSSSEACDTVYTGREDVPHSCSDVARTRSLAQDDDAISLISSIRGSSFVGDPSHVETRAKFAEMELDPDSAPTPPHVPPKDRHAADRLDTPTFAAEYRDLKSAHQHRHRGQSALQRLGYTASHASYTTEEHETGQHSPPPYLFLDAEPER